MPVITVKVVNGELVRQGLQNLARDVPRIGRNQIYTAMRRVYEVMRVYPPPRPRQKYVRTYTLRRSVKLLKRDDGYAIEVDPVQKGRHYGKYVVGDARAGSQAWMHVGRWNLLADVVEMEIQSLPPVIEEHLRRASKGYGLA